MNRRVPPRCACLLAGLCSVPAYAHHSLVAHFDIDREIEIRGEVVEFKLRSPHSSIVVDGVGYENGVPLNDRTERWEIEAESVPAMRRAGLDADSLQAGDALRVVVRPHKESELRFGNVNAAGLSEAIGAGGSAAPATLAAGTSQGGAVEGRWRSPGYIHGDDTPLPLNARGRAAWEAYDAKLSPISTCETESIPAAFFAPYLFDLRINGDTVILHNENYNVHREVPLGEEFAPAHPSGVLGEARARLENGSLIVESRNYPPSAWGLAVSTHLNGGGADVPSSDQKTVSERFSVSEDGRTLFLDYTLTDPVYMTRPYSGRVEMTRVSDETPMYDFECDPESASMFSRDAGDAPIRVGTD